MPARLFPVPSWTANYREGSECSPGARDAVHVGALQQRGSTWIMSGLCSREGARGSCRGRDSRGRARCRCTGRIQSTSPRSRTTPLRMPAWHRPQHGIDPSTRPTWAWSNAGVSVSPDLVQGSEEREGVTEVAPPEAVCCVERRRPRGVFRGAHQGRHCHCRVKKLQPVECGWMRESASVGGVNDSTCGELEPRFGKSILALK